MSGSDFRQAAPDAPWASKLVGDPVHSVEVLAQRYTLNEAKRSGVLRHLVAGAICRATGPVNAVTHFSQSRGTRPGHCEFRVSWAASSSVVGIRGSRWPKPPTRTVMRLREGQSSCSPPIGTEWLQNTCADPPWTLPQAA